MLPCWTVTQISELFTLAEMRSSVWNAETVEDFENNILFTTEKFNSKIES